MKRDLGGDRVKRDLPKRAYMYEIKPAKEAYIHEKRPAREAYIYEK